jgi:type I restriction enzyme S subunit
MNADRLLAHYERIADAIDAIPRLRRFVLDLAVRGKLVPQNPSDEPASDLLRRIAVGKARLLNEQKAKRQEPLNEPDPNQAPFDLPAGWSWARFPQLGTFGRGKSKHRPRNDPVLFEGGRHLMIQTGDVARSKGLIDSYTNKYNDFGLSQSLKWPKGTLCIAIAANIADSGILNFDACFPDSVVGFIPASTFDNARYFEYFLRTAKAKLLEFAPATAQKNINLEILTQVLIPLPPLAEQRRIVAKVDELMALCDRLEAARAGREATRDRLTAASLARLNAPDPDTFRDDARFALDALPALTARPDQIKHLRQTILNLAVRGKLVSQESKGESITITLRKAMARRAALVKAKKVRAKKFDGFDDLVAESDLPSSWALERLGNLVDPENTISYGVLVPGEEVPDGIPFVRAQDLALSGHPNRPNKTIAPEIEKAYARTRLRGGEILVCVVGSIGKLGIVPQSWAGANIARAVARILPIPDISREYLLLVLRGEPVQAYFTKTTRTLAQPTLNVGLIEQTPIPLPPFAEQNRIVAKVDELMSLCDRLEASLATADDTRRRLLDALLAEALAPADAREMEAAE